MAAFSQAEMMEHMRQAFEERGFLAVKKVPVVARLVETREFVVTLAVGLETINHADPSDYIAMGTRSETLPDQGRRRPFQVSGGPPKRFATGL